MITIPLRSTPNQRLTFNYGSDRWVIEIKVAISSMVCNLWLNNQSVILGERVVADVPIISFPHLAVNGNFGILTQGDNEPWWQSFNTSQRLVFWND